MTTPSLKDDKSTNSWGTPQMRVTTPVSPISTWGTLQTTSSSHPSLQAVIDHKSSWVPQTGIIVGSPQGWVSNLPPPLYPSPPPSTAASVGTYTYGGGYSSPSPFIPPSSLASPASICTQLCPLLDSRSPRCIEFDLGYPLNYMPNMNDSAVHPPVTFMQVFIVVQPFKWPVNIQSYGPVSVYQVLQQLQEYLQGYPSPQDHQRSKLGGCNVSQSDRFREQSNPNRFHSGQKRLDLLGRHRIFRGLSPEPGPNRSWIVHLSDR
ncbi:hypothetical protein BYT27DRAFT_7341865 [Phlegmacium glaucopus]|nr:hypothetical protein BYT27DRAFT_7341865 [Phlegmacium glaucopus]